MRFIDAAFDRLHARRDPERLRSVPVSKDSPIAIIHHVARNKTFRRGVDIDAPLKVSAHPLLPAEPSFDLCLPLPDRRGKCTFHAAFHN